MRQRIRDRTVITKISKTSSIIGIVRIIISCNLPVRYLSTRRSLSWLAWWKRHGKGLRQRHR
jgi:hypothetical protein